jgi:tRNA dimethylallyltransferase
MNADSKYLIVVCGPTAVGKTAVSIQLAQHFKTEIISSDSRQFYIETNAATAKPDSEELTLVPHHLINSLSIHQDYDVGKFEQDALKVLDDLYQKHDIVIVSGGSGLYIKALTEGLDKFPEIPEEIVDKLNQELQENGLEILINELQLTDSEYFKVVDQNNPQRIIRALSVIRHTGQKFSSFRSGNAVQRPFRSIFIMLDMDRAKLYERINRRVDIFLEKGLISEAGELYKFRHLNALKTVGYTELFDHFDGKHTLEEAIEKIKQHSRNYAKRQKTWMRKYIPGQGFDPEDFEGIVGYIKGEML